jgi:hypothetical protein
MNHPRRWLAMLVACGLAVWGCGPDSQKPSGTTSDPVEVCEDIAQVCRFDGAKLGVCTRQTDGGLACISQH